jgi:hypothetical protein
MAQKQRKSGETAEEWRRAQAGTVKRAYNGHNPPQQAEAWTPY